MIATTAGVRTQAQDAQQGGTIIEGNFGGDPKNLNPLLGNDTASQRVFGFLYPGLIGVDPKSGNFAQGAPFSLAKTWEASADGLTFTFHLRNDFKWSDGKPVTAKDYKFSYDALTDTNAKIDSALSGQILDLESVTAPDDYTVVIKLKAPQSCTTFNEIGYIYPIPAHVFNNDVTKIKDADYNINPTVTAGVFKFKEMRPSEQVTLVADQNFPDAEKGKVIPEGWIYKNVPDQTVLLEQFLAGQTNVIDGPTVGRRADLKKDANVKVYDFPGNSWDYIMFNQADPATPKSAADEKGVLTKEDQGHNPLFSDDRVRKALALGTNVDQMIKVALFGEGERLASGILPSSWAYDKSLKPLAYDPDAAGKLLDEAGFPKGADGLRVAKGAKYAKDGTPFKFALLTNDGNARRKASGTVFQDNMKQLGITVDFQTIDFNTLLDQMNAQTFDAVLLGWRNSFPDDPDQTALFTEVGDIVGSGNNNTSYANADMTKLQADALHVAGCDPTKRAEIYKQVQKLEQDTQPYMFLYVINGEYAAQKSVTGFDPLPSQMYWNVDTWAIAKSK